MSRFLLQKLCETDRFRRFVCDLCIDRGQKQISGLRTCQNRGRTPARREIPWHTWSDPGHFCCGVSPSLLQIHRFAVECLRFSLEIPQGTPVCFTMTRTPTANKSPTASNRKTSFSIICPTVWIFGDSGISENDISEWYTLKGSYIEGVMTR